MTTRAGGAARRATIGRLGPGARLAAIVVLSFVACSLFVLVRFGLTHRFAQGYLIWNLFLAAVPVGIAWFGGRAVLAGRTGLPVALADPPETAAAASANPAADPPSGARVSTDPAAQRARTWGLVAFAAWLVFYPNAPYIFTDFIHVVRRAGLGNLAARWMSEYDLLWYDIVMNSAFAFVGHYLGLVSMYLMHGTMRSLFGRVAGWATMVPAILLSGFGIHIGRFARFNSWDLAFYPVDSIKVMLRSIVDPAAALFSLAFALFIAITYLMYYLSKDGEAARRA